MLEIQIAGAGAGKTYGLAKKISARVAEQKLPKKIFALTFTNAAKTKIESELINEFGSIPENIFIETVHSFLLNEIIFPFSGYALGDCYNKSSIISLRDQSKDEASKIKFPKENQFKYKASKIKFLKENLIIHVEKVYSISMQIIDKDNAKHSTNIKKEKIDSLLRLLSKYIDSVFVDEVQDLDADALRFFRVLSSQILVHLVGDPKQAIKYPHDFNEFINELNSKNSGAERQLNLTTNNISRRVPNNILKISNKFCYPDQIQESISSETGVIKYIESTNNFFELFLQNTITNKGIICIDKRNDRYSTGAIKKFQFPLTIEKKIANSKHGKDIELVVKAALKEFQKNCLENNNINSIKLLIKQFDIEIEKSEYAQLCEMHGAIILQKNSKYRVSSIDSVKGLEADLCVIILTPNTYKYLTQNSLSKEQFFNKEWKKMYVALTRTRKELVFVIDHFLFKHTELDSIRENLKLLGAIEMKALNQQ